MFIVTVKSIDVDSLALPTLYGKTTLQNYDFSAKPARGWQIFLFSAGVHTACLTVAVVPSGLGLTLEGGE